ncbi:MAG: DUF6314 family protein [Pseudomonadota bacterium]
MSQTLSKTDGAALAALSARFAGPWELVRDITDLANRWPGRLEGVAQFIPQGDSGRLMYREEGLLTFAGLQAAKATRSYDWLIQAPDAIEVFFEDGRPFHRFDPTKREVEAEHLCDADLYSVRYVFETETKWRAEWRVEGPRKDYRMVSFYTRP